MAKRRHQAAERSGRPVKAVHRQGGRAASNGGDDASLDLQRDLPRSAMLASPMDDLNRSIVEMLQHDGRMSFIDIAKRLEVSEGTIRNRVNWMKQASMLRIVAIADPMAVNYKADAMLGIKIGATSTPRKVAERLTPHPAVVYMLWVSGRFDLLVEIVCDDDDGLTRFLETHVFGADDIASVEVMSGLEMFKNQFLLKRDLPL